MILYPILLVKLSLETNQCRFNMKNHSHRSVDLRMINKTFIAASLAMLILASCNKHKTTTAGGSVKLRNKMLVGATVESIRILSCPKYSKDGEQWDAYAPFATDPDLFLKMAWNDNQLFLSETFDNTPFGKEITIEQNLPLQLKPFDQPLLVEVFDEDGISNDDNVGYFTFVPADHRGQEFVKLQAGDLVIELKMSWQFK